jgi:hypothetical protein
MWFLTIGLAMQALVSGLLLEEDRVDVPVRGVPKPRVLRSGTVLYTDSVSRDDVENVLRSFHEAPDEERRKYPLYGIVLSTNSDKISTDSQFRSELSAIFGTDLCFIYFSTSGREASSGFLPSDHALAVYPLARLLGIQTSVLPGVLIYNDSQAIFTSELSRKEHSVYVPIGDLEFDVIVSRIRGVCDAYQKGQRLADVSASEWRRALKERLASGAKAAEGPLSTLAGKVAESVVKGLKG